jgi:hypothetical protein
MAKKKKAKIKGNLKPAEELVSGEPRPIKGKK